MNDYFDKQEKQIKKAQKGKEKDIPKGPAIKSPTYSTKARQ